MGRVRGTQDTAGTARPTSSQAGQVRTEQSDRLGYVGFCLVVIVMAPIIIVYGAIHDTIGYVIRKLR